MEELKDINEMSIEELQKEHLRLKIDKRAADKRYKDYCNEERAKRDARPYSKYYVIPYI